VQQQFDRQRIASQQQIAAAHQQIAAAHQQFDEHFKSSIAECRALELAKKRLADELRPVQESACRLALWQLMEQARSAEKQRKKPYAYPHPRPAA
jgi:hypothetical protein